MKIEISATQNDILKGGLEIAMAKYQEEKDRLFYLQEKAIRGFTISSLLPVVLTFLNVFTVRERTQIWELSMTIYGIVLIILFLIIAIRFYTKILKRLDYKTVMGYKFFIKQINENDPIKFNKIILEAYINAYTHNSRENEKIVKQIQKMNRCLLFLTIWATIGMCVYIFWNF